MPHLLSVSGGGICQSLDLIQALGKGGSGIEERARGKKGIEMVTLLMP